MSFVIPFRSRLQRNASRKVVETRARRKELAAMSQQLAPLHRYSATELERLFWDVVESIRSYQGEVLRLAGLPGKGSPPEAPRPASLTNCK